MTQYVMTLSCPDRVGIVAAVASFLTKHEGFILESSQFGDASTNLFFMRTLFQAGEHSPSYQGFIELFSEIAEKFQMNWQLSEMGKKPNVLIMVSKQGHCLNALLNKRMMGTLPINIPAIVSNHTDLQEMAKWYDIPFYHLPVTSKTKQEQESRVLALIEEHEIDLVVLARYMQILSNKLVGAMVGKIINIHHSFLPSFKGAKPYHQAFDRGVKLIGATAHYVSEKLDEGPIIEQEVLRVDHSFKPEQLVAIGQDIESIALARAVTYHIEHRIFIDGHKTVVFR